MPLRHASGKPGWFSSILSDKRARIAHLFAEVAGLGAPADMKPSVFRKFLALMTQIAQEEEKELDFITHIEAIELKHRFRRDHDQLEHADPTYLPMPANEFENNNGSKGLWQSLRSWLHPDNKDNSH